ncbi:MAG TPA: hypothetical protein VH142_01720 [Polyangiaceae bacterium]|nr:hypothetical protein [Polyangiaceae bacterium]
MAIFAASAVTGCAGSNPMKKQVVALQTEVTELRADQDRLEERLAAVELSGTTHAKAPSVSAAPRVEHPRLKVVHLSPDAEAESSDEPVDAPAVDTDKTSADRRPIIRGTGDRVVKVGDAEGSDDGAASAELAKEAHRN